MVIRSEDELSKIPVGILGATGSVGQKFVSLLADHPFFRVVSLMGSDRSVGRKFGELVPNLSGFIPQKLLAMEVQPSEPRGEYSLVFSGLPSEVASQQEVLFASSGCFVISNASSHRMEAKVPLLIPEVNADHLQLLDSSLGSIVTNPNCSVVAIVAALKPLVDAFGVSDVQIVTMQAVSGSGYPGVSAYDVLGNVIPYIPGEEEKVETEPAKILGKFCRKAKVIQPYPINVSACCTRVPVLDGHTACVSVKLRTPASRKEIIDAWENYSGEPQEFSLPSAPKKFLYYLEDLFGPQPVRHSRIERGMSIIIGRLCKSSVLDWKFVVVSHNTIRGAAGGAILNAELMLQKGLLAHCLEGSSHDVGSEAARLV
ncbi:aspartate-semialdehyde dehydrogenase [Chlamydiifrater phoenicopteri]|uniref:aspartate-semialdehyde dehydrogenase n=1 Tax=Chlamydiifrater phoenicopteri TaxID=2681469 RepID=UPI001BD165DF|nr:aspartate-semialdehyde dehydrogenase [Chlamydiifrater phoenicopteri]